jgi:hypothetical protein
MRPGHQGLQFRGGVFGKADPTREGPRQCRVGEEGPRPPWDDVRGASCGPPLGEAVPTFPSNRNIADVILTPSPVLRMAIDGMPTAISFRRRQLSLPVGIPIVPGALPTTECGFGRCSWPPRLQRPPGRRRTAVCEQPRLRATRGISGGVRPALVRMQTPPGTPRRMGPHWGATMG